MSHWKPVCLGALIVFLWIALASFAFGPLPVTAQTLPASYEECFFGRQETVDIDDSGTVETPEQDRLIRVPPGWTVVSAGGNEDHGLILFCR